MSINQASRGCRVLTRPLRLDSLTTVDASPLEYLRMIQGVIARLSQNSFQLKKWAVTLPVALQVFFKGEAAPADLFVPTLPVLAFWLLDSWYLLRADGIAAVIDQFNQDELIHWRRVEGKVPADVGKGVFWEGTLIYDYRYDEKGNQRCVPVLFDSDDSSLPQILHCLPPPYFRGRYSP